MVGEGFGAENEAFPRFLEPCSSGNSFLVLFIDLGSDPAIWSSVEVGDKLGAEFVIFPRFRAPCSSNNIFSALIAVTFADLVLDVATGSSVEVAFGPKLEAFPRFLAPCSSESSHPSLTAGLSTALVFVREDLLFEGDKGSHTSSVASLPPSPAELRTTGISFPSHVR